MEDEEDKGSNDGSTLPCTADCRSWHIWQMVDSALPIGGFAHSYGLEAALQLGHYDMKDRSEDKRVKGLSCFCRHLIKQQAGLLLPIVYAACMAAVRAPKTGMILLERWRELDIMCHALMTTEGSRRASIAQGQALLRLACDAFPSLSTAQFDFLSSARSELRATSISADGLRNTEPPKGHHPPLFGLICQFLQIELETVGQMFLFLALRDVIAAATRLGLCGPILAVRLQMSLYPHTQAAAAAVQTSIAEVKGDMEDRDTLSEDSVNMMQPVQKDPLLDILQGAHEQLYSRVFNS